MDLWRLRVFCKVVELRSFSRAAAGVRLSQPTVSSHVKDLEDHFGCRLIDRLGRSVAPTPAGELLYRQASDLLARYDGIEAEMAGYQGRVAGRLVIGGSTIPAGHILPGLIGAYRRAYPQVTVCLLVGDTEKVFFDILSGKAELAVVGGRTADRRIVQQPFLTDEMRVVVPASHPWAGRKTVAVADLAKEPFIVRERGSGTRSALEESLAARGAGIEGLNVVAELGSTEAVVQGIKSGIGVSVLSSMAVAADVRAGMLKALALRGVKLTRVFYLAFLRDRSQSPAANAFCTLIAADRPK
ncbi:selenium metabolism-associated LysR family transcriptional regulator [Desulfosudis oleivorans]|uniref:Transcriptional regulator, LysR family n=1 Tax=Desulfosudis oleivorans (strain DSM 6200 / JCM 39069 / Hxd3) TaxID=96561 RepID=A8ZUD0_DESOH|nr:selenium metabolism-associated LysR family transcriptional regulator [Desulfosudis oleivorans]ABW67962.1 transcriptional regulator, LysR family [Desulfosudis oleivorans Hxd3]